jgi:hypothetical protein
MEPATLGDRLDYIRKLFRAVEQLETGSQDVEAYLQNSLSLPVLQKLRPIQFGAQSEENEVQIYECLQAGCSSLQILEDRNEAENQFVFIGEYKEFPVAQHEELALLPD